MSNIARLEIIEHRKRWKIKSPFGESWTSSTFHGPDHLKPIAVNAYNLNNKGQYDGYAILVQTGTGWF